MGLETATGLSFAFIVLGIVVAIAWVLLPFAMFGTKPLLRSLLRAQERNHDLMQQLIAVTEKANARGSAAPSTYSDERVVPTPHPSPAPPSDAPIPVRLPRLPDIP